MERKPKEMFWRGKCIATMTRDELLQIIITQDLWLERERSDFKHVYMDIGALVVDRSAHARRRILRP